MPLPKEQAEREDLLLAIHELKCHPAWPVVQERLRGFLEGSQRELASLGTEARRMRQLQGEVSAYTKAIRVLDDIEKELKQGGHSG